MSLLVILSEAKDDKGVRRGLSPPEAGLYIERHAGIAQLVEHNLAKVGVAGSSPVSRSGARKGSGRGRSL